MEITRSGSRPSASAGNDYFTGTVRQDPVVTAPEPARVRAAFVTFEPGARTHWHTHPLGQTLHVVSGFGLAQTEGEPVREIRPGDSIWFPPGERHWHGAGPDTAMCHLAIHEALDGEHVAWEDPVSDADYGGARE
jgi:quercetin dioxygenase-like cupin family protein